MLKKVHNSTPDVPSATKDCLQCSVCNSLSTKTIFFVCNSGHVTCDSCQNSDAPGSRQDGGDFAADITYAKHVRRIKKNHSVNVCAQIKDLASGDHVKGNKTSDIKLKTKSQCKIKSKCNNNIEEGFLFSDDNNYNYNGKLETTLEFKNPNFHANSGSVLTNLASGEDIDNQVSQLYKNRVCPRPVTCPIHKCGKMIALDSVMLHFYFDHSKVPRMSLNSESPRQITLHPSDLTLDPQCFAVFILQNKNALSSHQKQYTACHVDTFTDCKSLMLMSAKMPFEGFKIRDRNKINLPITQNGDTTCDETGKHGIDCKSFTNEMFKRNEIILFWLCKLDDNPYNYSLTIQRKDNKHGYNYIGEATNIRDDQDALSAYHKSDCLIIHGTAANRLLDERNQLSIVVNILE